MYNAHFNNNLVRFVSLAKPAHQFTKFSVHILKDTKNKITFLNMHTAGGVLLSKTYLIYSYITNKNSSVNNNNNNNNNNK